ncbi:hypothetical protein Tco_0389781 [Tanacetum coccineum]
MKLVPCKARWWWLHNTGCDSRAGVGIDYGAVGWRGVVAFDEGGADMVVAAVVSMAAGDWPESVSGNHGTGKKGRRRKNKRGGGEDVCVARVSKNEVNPS